MKKWFYALGVGALLAAIIVGVYFLTLSDPKGNRLLAATVIYRHGEQIPSFYKTDPYKDLVNWTAPAGELTNVGKNGQYKLGQWLRNRFNGFLSELYIKSEVYIHSADINRCLMSAATNLAGLYPPKGKDIWEKDFPWQPIPIHTIQSNKDDTLNAITSCDKYLKILQALPEYTKANEKYAELFKNLADNSGESINDIRDATHLYETLAIESGLGKSIPDWANKSLDTLKEISELTKTILTSNEQLSKLITGRLYHQILSQFNYASNTDYSNITEDNSSQKVRIFSALDVEVLTSLNALRDEQLTNVPFDGSVLFELWEKPDKGRFVEISYKTDDNITSIAIKNCTEKCNFDKFEDIITPLALSENDFREECKV